VVVRSLVLFPYRIVGVVAWHHIDRAGKKQTGQIVRFPQIQTFRLSLFTSTYHITHMSNLCISLFFEQS
jgi:hypothetical protein